MGIYVQKGIDVKMAKMVLTGVEMVGNEEEKKVWCWSEMLQGSSSACACAGRVASTSRFFGTL